MTRDQTGDAENRLNVVTDTVTGQVTRFVYDGDGNRVLRIGPEGTTVYIGDYYEKQGSVVTKYYYAAGQRVAMRVGGVVYYLHGDHLGSASLATNASGAKVSEMRYLPYGGTRNGTMPTDRRFTGQREEVSLGFYDYGARPYAPALGRFLQADTLVPGAASGAGGGAATLGYDSQTRLTPLTVNLGEFVAQVNAENREILQFGPFYQWDARTRQEHNVPSGPYNPQALNRYAYVLNNPGWFN